MKVEAEMTVLQDMKFEARLLVVETSKDGVVLAGADGRRTTARKGEMLIINFRVDAA